MTTTTSPEPTESPGATLTSVTVPMQGTIVKVLVEVGDEVEAGQAVCVLEAMKVENNITADKAGTVKEIKAVSYTHLTLPTIYSV